MGGFSADCAAQISLGLARSMGSESGYGAESHTRGKCAGAEVWLGPWTWSEPFLKP